MNICTRVAARTHTSKSRIKVLKILYIFMYIRIILYMKQFNNNDRLKLIADVEFCLPHCLNIPIQNELCVKSIIL